MYIVQYARQTPCEEKRDSGFTIAGGFLFSFNFCIMNKYEEKRRKVSI
jgi:hypothetical protein